MSSKILILFLCFFSLLKSTEQDFERLNQELVRLEKKYPKKNCHSAHVPLLYNGQLMCWLKAVKKREAHYKQWIIEYRKVWANK